MKSIRHLLIVILVVFTTGALNANPKPAGGWVFYGLLLTPTEKGIQPQWQPNGPNFTILEPGSTLLTVPKAGMAASCIRTMNIRAKCLEVQVNVGPGAYHWGELTGNKVNPGEKVNISSVTKLPSKIGDYYWMKVEPQPGR